MGRGQGGKGRGAWAVVGVQFILVWGCAQTANVPVPAPEPGHIQARHFDQVCTAPGRTPTEVRMGELFDTVGLFAEVSAAGVRPLPLAPPWPIYDFVVLYGRHGGPVAAGAFDATVDEAKAAVLEEVLLRRLRELPPLLVGAGYRVQVVFRRRVTIGLAPPAECMPHMAHPAGGRPYGLAQGVTTWLAPNARIRGDDRTAVVRIRVGVEGEVLGVDSVMGSGEMVNRARAQVPLLRFDPALRNGVPLEGELIQAFRFRPEDPHPAGGVDRS